MNLPKTGSILLVLLLAAMAMVPMANASNGDDVYYEKILITSFGDVSDEMQQSMALKDVKAKAWISQLSKVTADLDKDLDKYYYPNGPVIGHGYDLYGTMDVQIDENWSVDQATISEIYKVVEKAGEKNGIKNIPCKFLSMGLIKTESRYDQIRPVVGGTQLTSTGGWVTAGFRARDSSGNVGIVTTGHFGSVGSTVYQPDSSISGSSIGTISVIGSTNSDSSFIPYSNTAGTYYYSDGVYLPYSGWIAPTVGDSVTKNGAATGFTSGTVILINSAYNPYLGKYLPNQVFATYSSASGDSGAPVFLTYDTFFHLLEGIHMGSNSQGYGVYSPVSGVDTDLGVTPYL